MNTKVQRALLSVSDKEGIVMFAQALHSRGVEILSTGGTAKLLVKNAVPVIEVSDHTGYPEMMDGRVKTLHPTIHGGILGRRGVDEEVMVANNIAAIDLVVVNLYPFQKTIDQPDCSLALAIENIDIGGPTMLRAAAKNHADVAVVVDAGNYPQIIQQLEENDGLISEQFKFELAVRAFEHTAAYDGMIANYLGRKNNQGNDRADFSNTFNMQFIKQQEMRYGENPHQKAAFYVSANNTEPNIASAQQIQGKELSYNNIADTDAALECVKQFEHGEACVIVKHANPCGVAIAESQLDAYQKAFMTDSESAFGGIIAFNSELQGNVAEKIVGQQFVEVIIAPSVSLAAQEALKSKQNVRLLQCGSWQNLPVNLQDKVVDFKKVSGGLLVQDRDNAILYNADVVTDRRPEESEMADLLFAWNVAKYVKSNAIVFASNLMTIGVGAGQMSRINSARIAAIKAQYAGLQVKGAIMASDAFFPFRDGLDNAAEYGIRAVIQPGGSMRDDEVIAAANEHGMAMIFTAMRHFRH